MSKLYFRSIVKTHPWFRSLWLNLSLLGIATLSIVMVLATGAPFQYLIGQIFLNISVYISLWLLADRPLLNPIQAVVAIFYWWFGVGPTVVSGWKLLLDMKEEAIYAQVSGMEALWIVIPGLLIYSFIARNTLRWINKTNCGLKFLAPSGSNYRMKSLIIFLFLGALFKFILLIHAQIGTPGLEFTNYLGGKMYHEWWVGVIEFASNILMFANSAIIFSLVQSGRGITRPLKILGVLLFIFLIISAITSGWKGAFILPGIYIISSYISQKQRIPWIWISIGIIIYLFVIEPFVTTGRYLAEKMNIQTIEERREIFRGLLSDKSWLEDFSWKDIKIESPFRGIYQLAGEVTRRNNMLYGEWQGYTIIWGLSVLVPRVIYPEKAMMNIGNFFALTIGVDLGLISSRDDITNISITIPFEMVGNFGWCAGVLSFGLIAICWSIFCTLILSSSRLSNHPLTPFLIGFALGLEQPTGHFLANLRMLIIPIFLIFLVRVILRKKL